MGVAVSGGKDSLTLLSVLNGLTSRQGWKLVALTVDEGVAGYRDEAIDHASSAARQMGLDHVVVSYRELFDFTLDQALNWKDQREVSSCSICGVFRRRAIDEAGARAGVDVIATAHNLDDYVQTFMMNLLHGDVERIAWQEPTATGEEFPLRRVKPFMEIYEEEIALFAYLSQIPFQSASCPYMHEGLRSEVRNYVNKMEASHPGMKNVLLKSSLEVISKFGPSARKPAIPCSDCGKPSSSGLCNVCRTRKEVNQHIDLQFPLTPSKFSTDHANSS